MFKVMARSVLELGSELISSDVIAFYELIKNSFDAGTKNGVDIRFQIVLGLRAYRELARLLRSDDATLEVAYEQVLEKLHTDAGSIYDRALEHLGGAKSIEALQAALEATYALNRITVSDTGSGMSKGDLESIYLMIGTSSRKKDVQKAFDNKERDAPYLGEKGIGRLSAMRLGDALTVKTAPAKDSRWNRLDIDWTEFDDLDAMLDDIDIKPFPGGKRTTQRNQAPTFGSSI